MSTGTTSAPRRALHYPAPLIIPSRSTHTHTMIMLHGRGDTASAFGPPFAASTLSSGQTLAQRFPGLKFVFPSAKLRRMEVYNGDFTAWFDYMGPHQLDERQDLQLNGLRESTAWVREIAREEARLVGARNVVVAGFSQGCATGLHVVLGWGAEEGEEEGLGGFVGMSGFLPFARQLGNIALGKDEDNQGGERVKMGMLSAATKAVNFVREEIMELPPIKSGSSACLEMPIWLGHGVDDDRVNIKLGENAAEIMGKLGWDVVWRSYDGLGHWYREGEEIDDITAFLEVHVGVLGTSC